MDAEDSGNLWKGTARKRSGKLDVAHWRGAHGKEIVPHDLDVDVDRSGLEQNARGPESFWSEDKCFARTTSIRSSLRGTALPKINMLIASDTAGSA